jgi:hypothetical protein
MATLVYSVAMTTTTQDVRDAFDNLNTVIFQTEDNVVQVTVAEDDIGAFYAELRDTDFEANTKRIGNRLVSRIEADESADTLGDLFA